MTIPIGKRIEQLDDFPTLPQSLHRILSELDAIETTADSLDKIIGEDPMLTARILRVANSAAYGAMREISSISRAVMTMGFDEVRNIVIALSLTGAFANDLEMDEFDISELWLHSVGVAKAAQLLARHVKTLDENEMFTAGLIHDLGRVLSCLYFQDEMRAIFEKCRQNSTTLLEAEKELELAHGEVGAYLAVKWGFSDLLATVVRYHHSPTAAGNHIQAASLIYLADGLAKKIGLGWSHSDDDDRLLIPKSLGIKGATIKGVAKQLNDEKKELLASWSQVIFN